MIEIDGMKVYTLVEVAKLIGVHKATVRAYIKKGKLKAKKVGGKWMITTDALKELYKSE